MKKMEPVYGMHREQGFSAPRYGITHYRTTEFTLDEQNYLNSRVFLQLQKFHFMLGRGQAEGALPTVLVPVTVEHMDAGQFPDKTKVDLVRSQLTARDGIPEATLLDQIAARTKHRQQISGSRHPLQRDSQGSDGEAPAQPARTCRPHDTRHTASQAPAHRLGPTEATETVLSPRPPEERRSERPRPTPGPSAPPPIRRYHPNEQSHGEEPNQESDA